MQWQNVPYLRAHAEEPNQRPEQSSKYNILDLYLPAGDLRTSTPLLVFIHGGAWRASRPSNFSEIARQFADRGLAVALVGYRLSTVEPGESTSRIAHPSHVNDVAAGVAWLFAAGGGLLDRCDDEPSNAAAQALQAWNPQNLFVSGHSAGAQIGSFLALDANYIQNALASLLGPSKTPERAFWMSKMRGFIGVEGIYDIPLIVKNYPTYKDWFIVAAFGEEPGSGWVRGSPALCQAFNPPLSSTIAHLVPHLVIHSPDDELVDVIQSRKWFDLLCGFRAATPGAENWELDFEAEKLVGKHDDVILSKEFFDYVSEWIEKRVAV
ncbi:Kynurenine formamidase [Podochytrium sp. JEL0797]|nr:Kynurenine formamidase [Podochytrium sp. JEL0797]